MSGLARRHIELGAVLEQVSWNLPCSNSDPNGQSAHVELCVCVAGTHLSGDCRTFTCPACFALIKAEEHVPQINQLGLATIQNAQSVEIRRVVRADRSRCCVHLLFALGTDVMHF